MSRLSERALRRLAWVAWWTTVGAGGVRAMLLWDERQPQVAASTGTAVSEYAFLAVILTFPLVGLVILVRQARNRIGWLLQGVGLAWLLSWLLDAYARYGLMIEPGSLPGAGVAAAINEGSWTWGILVMGIYLVLLFPDGNLPTPRWRWMAWLSATAAVVIQVVVALSPGELVQGPIDGMQNPIGLESLEVPLLVVLAIFLPVFPISIVAAAVSLALRFRRSHGIEREQIKWLATAGAVVALCYVATLVSTLATELTASDPSAYVAPLGVRLLEQISVLTFLLLPLAIGAAVLRYRLYDIDLVIHRTLVYGTLTATLAAAYLTSVLVLRVALDPLTSGSDLAVAASTLAVAALFRPLRSRIQAAVDRRFYRARYDATRTLDRFATRLRDEIDLETLHRDLRWVVFDTVHPTSVTLWLRDSGSRS